MEDVFEAEWRCLRAALPQVRAAVHPLLTKRVMEGHGQHQTGISEVILWPSALSVQGP